MVESLAAVPAARRPWMSFGVLKKGREQAFAAGAARELPGWADAETCAYSDFTAKRPAASIDRRPGAKRITPPGLAATERLPDSTNHRNGFTIFTPSMVLPCCMSSVSTTRQAACFAERRMSASQNEIR